MAEPVTMSDAAAVALHRACACLYASASLKNDASEGGLTEPQAKQVRAWKARLTSAGTRHLADLARSCAARGGAAAPRPASLDLRPYSPAALDELCGEQPRPNGAADLPPAATALLAPLTEDEPLPPLDGSFPADRPVRAEPVQDDLTAGVARLFAEAWDTTLEMLTASDGAPVA